MDFKESGVRKHARQPRIAIVDDIPDFVASMTELFQDCWGYSKISGFCSGPDFLEHYRKGENEPPDIVFLDIDLPYMNGLDVLKCALLDDIFKKLFSSL